MSTLETYAEVHERFKPAAAEIADPIAFFRHARKCGCSTLTIYVLLRDFYNKGVRECQEIHREAEIEGAI